jgi:hypothetical protein
MHKTQPKIILACHTGNQENSSQILYEKWFFSKPAHHFSMAVYFVLMLALFFGETDTSFTHSFGDHRSEKAA